MQIEHMAIPGFIMDVKAEEPCEISATRPTPHSQYQVIDPDGNIDWICAYDVRTLPDRKTPKQRGLEGYDLWSS